MTISKHAKERYAERIRNKEEKIDIGIYVAQNEERIQKDIEKMIEYGTCIYDDMSTKQSGKRVSVYLNGLWVIIYDPTDEIVVTLYKVDLGLGDDFDKEFAEKALEKITASQKEYDAAKEETKETKKIYEDLIHDNRMQIKEYKTMIQSLESQIENYKDIINTISVNYEIKREELKQNVMILTGKKIF